MTVFDKVDAPDVRVGIELDDRLWPKADFETESKSEFANGSFGGESGRSEDSIPPRFSRRDTGRGLSTFWTMLRQARRPWRWGYGWPRCR